MIIDMRRFVEAERPYWTELEQMLDAIEKDPAATLDLRRARRLHYLYQRVSAGLARTATFSFEREIRGYLEALVSRAYGEIHGTRERAHRFAPFGWLGRTFPRTFRRHLRAFGLSCAVLAGGGVLGGGLLAIRPEARVHLMTAFPHLMLDPAERVRREEATRQAGDPLAGRKAHGAVAYFTHNTRVSLTVFASGIAWGMGTILALFYNGVLLGAVAADYTLAGQSTFLWAWLLPHGSVEIPAILIAGQTGLVLGGAIIGWGRRLGLRARLRRVAPDLVTLVGGTALLLVWAGFIEAFLSQYHAPVLPYGLKIGLGAVQLLLLALYLMRGGREEGESR